MRIFSRFFSDLRLTMIMMVILQFSIQPSQAASSKLPIGMNASGHAYYSPDVIFKDLFRKFHIWEVFDGTTGEKLNEVISVDSDGYPLPQSNRIYQALYGTHMDDGFYTGDYVLLWDGTGDVTVGGGATNINISDHRVTFTLNNTKNLPSVIIENNGLLDHVRNIRIVQAQYEGDYLVDPVHPDYLQLVSAFPIFRFMNLMSSNDPLYRLNGRCTSVTANTITIENGHSEPAVDFYKGWFVTLEGTAAWPRRLITGSSGAVLTLDPGLAPGEVPSTPSYELVKCVPETWAERTLPSEIVQGGPKGMALEYIVEIADKAQINPWLVIPPMANDDYIQQMAQYVKTNFSDKNPSLKVYVEYSNETWNALFPAYTVGEAMGKKLGIGGTHQYHAYKASHIFDIWSQVYGEDSLSANRSDSRLVRVLGSQNSVPWIGLSIMDFDDWPSNDPLIGSNPSNPRKAHEYADALAIAPYLEFVNTNANDFRTLSTDDILERFKLGVDNSVQNVQNELVNTLDRNLKLLCYEGGPYYSFWYLSNADSDRIMPYVKAVFDRPLLRAHYLDFLNRYNALDDPLTENDLGVFTAFSLFSNIPSKYGNWGHLRSQLVPEYSNNKWQALMDYVNDRQTPVAPNQLVASALGSQKIELRWYDNSVNETGFSLERKNGLNGSFQVIKDDISPDTSVYVDQNKVFAASTYIYRIKSKNLSGSSEYSNEATVQTPSVNAEIPSAPRELIAIPDSSSSVHLKWINTATDATSVIVQRKKGSETQFSDVLVLDPLLNIAIDMGLMKTDKPFTYRVLAARGPWRSSPSNEWTVTELMPDWSFDPQAPALVGELGTSNNVLLEWTLPGSATNFTVQRGASYSGPFADIGTTTDLSFIDSNQPTGVWFYQVRANFANNSNALSNVAMVDVHPTAFYLPNKPIGLSASPAGPNKIALSWVDMSDNESSFLMERLEANGTWATAASLGQNSVSYLDEQLLPGTNYSYRIKTLNSFGDSEYSNVATAKTLDSTTNGGGGVQPAVKVVPAIVNNLEKSSVRIENMPSGSSRVRLIDSQLRIRDEINNLNGSTALDFPVRELPSGSYVLEISGGDSRAAVRFVVIH